MLAHLGAVAGFPFQPFHCSSNPYARGRVHAFTVKESLNCVLGYSRLAHELPQRETSCSEDKCRVGCPSVSRSVSLILDRSRVFEKNRILPFLTSSLYFLPDKAKRQHCCDGTTQQQSSRIVIAGFSIGREGFVFPMEVMTPNDSGKSLRRKDFTVVFPRESNCVSAVNLRVIPR